MRVYVLAAVAAAALALLAGTGVAAATSSPAAARHTVTVKHKTAVKHHAKKAVKKKVKPKPKPKLKPSAVVAISLGDIVIKGKGFQKGEKLTVSFTTTTTNESWKRVVKATATGTFSLTIAHTDLSSCDQYTVTIVGSLKSRFTTSHSLIPC